MSRRLTRPRGGRGCPTGDPREARGNRHDDGQVDHGATGASAWQAGGHRGTVCPSDEPSLGAGLGGVAEIRPPLRAGQRAEVRRCRSAVARVHRRYYRQSTGRRHDQHADHRHDHDGPRTSVRRRAPLRPRAPRRVPSPRPCHGGTDSGLADASAWGPTLTPIQLSSGGGRTATVTLTRSAAEPRLTRAPRGAAVVAARFATSRSSPRASSREPARAALTQRIWSTPIDTADSNSAATNTAKGSATASSAVTVPVSSWPTAEVVVRHRRTSAASPST